MTIQEPWESHINTIGCCHGDNCEKGHNEDLIAFIREELHLARAATAMRIKRIGERDLLADHCLSDNMLDECDRIIKENTETKNPEEDDSNDPFNRTMPR